MTLDPASLIGPDYPAKVLVEFKALCAAAGKVKIEANVVVPG